MHDKYGYKDMYSAGFHHFNSLEEKWAYWSKMIYLNRYKCRARDLYKRLYDLVKDKDYFDQSNGGITISGGEPFMQLDAFLELIKQCKNNGLHVAVETTGNYCLDTLKEALPYIDLFLMDLKHLDAQKLKDITGGNLDLILNNFKYLAQHCPNKVIVRMPVIPRFNDDICEDVIRFCANLKLSEVNLLPFHTMGKSKWNQLNKEFMYDKDKMMDRNDLTPYIDVGKQLGVYVKIGG